MLFDKERRDIERIFNCNVFDVYGTNDAGILSYECDLHDGYHYNMESAYVEITDEDQPLTEYREYWAGSLN